MRILPLKKCHNLVILFFGRNYVQRISKPSQLVIVVNMGITTRFRNMVFNHLYLFKNDFLKITLHHNLFDSKYLVLIIVNCRITEFESSMYRRVQKERSYIENLYNLSSFHRTCPLERTINVILQKPLC